MSTTRSRARRRMRPCAWARVIVLLALLVGTSVTLTDPAGADAPLPLVAVVGEAGGESTHDSPESTLRLPTRHPTHLPDAPSVTRAGAVRARPWPRPGPAASYVPSALSLRCIVLRC
ncbi:hypothetical protein [Streptomyces himalayensis]|uniref:Uncharacterized protein n=2 Tax=Streptomyces himalayensis TaxID=2820085 RepID=A0A7W2HJP2_9ACTN|nr:hypothetical protein [Streptomyces himalayensis]MBA2950109.1 hypothetical protein [Streptomyces himalayensis subsp. himalayensis]MBA4866054.1 hypothetical protein [Streptomyces himalayensis subsp. aureolus]